MIRANRPTDEWEACPAGALRGLSQRLRSRRRIRTIRNFAAVAVLLLGVTGLGLRGMLGTHDPMTCREVHEKADAYVARRLSRAASEELEKHIGHCAHCREIVDAARRKLPAAPPPQARMKHRPADHWIVAQTR